MDIVGQGFDDRLAGLGIALAVGFIVGLQREWAEDKPLGLRSFALISALGGMSALMLDVTGGWPIAAGLLALGIVLAAQVYRKPLSGLTTLVASLVVFLIGAAAVAGYWLHAIVLGGAVTLVLHWKRPLHGWVHRLGERDFEIIARFVLISAVILPVMPDRTYGPYDVFNPFKAWLLVVLIVGLNLAGYVAFRLIGARAGSWMAGILGGMISSTATTVSYAGMSKRGKQLATVAALVILVASTVVYARVALEVLVVAPPLLPSIVAPAVVFSAVLLGLSGVVYYRIYRSPEFDAELPERGNPAQIKLALTFGALYAAILIAVAAARDLIGDDAIYGVAFVSGLTDVDALTLSISQVFQRGEIGSGIAWRAIFLASLSNLLFKMVAVAVLGSAELRRWIWATGGVALLAGVALLVLWP